MTNSRGIAAGSPRDHPASLVRDVRIVPLTGSSAAGSGPSTALTSTAAPAAEPAPLVDIRIADGVITELGPRLARHEETVIEGGGRWVIPGLWDAHVHLGQWALAATRLDLSGVRSVDEAVGVVRAALARSDRPSPGSPASPCPSAPAASARPPSSDVVVQGFGHRSTTWSRAPRTADLDALADNVAIVLISGDAHHGWLNSAAMRLLGLPHRDGIVEELEWFAAYPRLCALPQVRAQQEAGYREVVARMNARGLVGVVDLEFGDGYVEWPRRVAGPAAIDTLRVRPAVYPDGLDAVLDAGVRTGDALPGGQGLLRMGPLKIIADGSLTTRTAYCCEPYTDVDVPHHGVQNVPPEELSELLRRSTGGGLEVAVHAIGDAAVRDALDAFAATAARGSIEHAQLLRGCDVRRFAELGVTASVQPAHLWDDRDVVARCWADRQDRCFPWRSLADAGVLLRLGSDAPVSPLDPWLGMAAAVHRSADDRAPWHPEQSLRVWEALSASTGSGLRGGPPGRRVLAPGAPADLVLLDLDPLAVPDGSREASSYLMAMPVAATILGGRVVHAA